jgi:RNA polymerase sigma-70 factor (ECF subfamily)
VTASSHQELLAAAADGNDEALRVLLQAYHERAYRFGLRVCRDGYDADDAVQEAFSKLAERPDVMQDERVFSWLMTVVRHACMRMLRPFARQRRTLGERIEDVNTVADQQVDAVSALERWEMVRAVHAAIASLARPYREVLLMRDLEGLSGDATAEALGLDLSTMKTRLHRARLQLRDALVKHAKGVL